MARQQIRWVALSAILLTLAAPPAIADVEFKAMGPFRLPGDLEVITMEDRGQQRITVDTWIKAGAAQDFPGYPGLAAAVAAAVAEGGLGRAIEGLGGKLTHAVDRDTTHFSATVPAERLAEALPLLGEAVARLDWAAIDMAMIRQRLAASRAAMSPAAIATDRLLAELNGPAAGHGVYGFEAATRDLTVEPLKAFYDRHYVPAKTRVVLVGDLDTGKSVGQVVNGFAALLKRTPGEGAVPSRPLAAPAVRWTAGETRVVAGARGPAFEAQRELAAMDMLAEALAGSDKARLPRALAGKAKSVSAAWHARKGPGALVIQVVGETAETMAVEKAVRDVLSDLRTGTVSLDEHARAMRALTTAYEKANQTHAEQAATLGYFQTMAGDYRWARTYPEVVRQVSRQDMMAVAQKYLTPDAIKVVVLKP